MLTDYFVADQNDADTLVNDFTRKPDLSTNGADNFVLAGLWTAIDADAETERLEGDDYIVSQGGSEGPWVFDLPDDFTLALSNIASHECTEICEKWAQTEELAIQGVTASDLTDPLKQLQSVAALACGSGKRMLLRMAM